MGEKYHNGDLDLRYSTPSYASQHVGSTGVAMSPAAAAKAGRPLRISRINPSV